MRRNQYFYLFTSALVVVLLGIVGAISIQSIKPEWATSPTLPPISAAASTLRPTTTAMVAQDKYLTQVSFAPSSAKYFDPVNAAFALTPDELALLKQNGFVVSDRLAFMDFRRAYAYIYWKDLPVLVTSDSIMQAIHQAYDDILVRVEIGLLLPRLSTLLERLRDQIRSSHRPTDIRLSRLYADLETYITVPLALLNDATYDTPGVFGYAAAARAAKEVRTVQLFGGERIIDFTLFTPRGHYTKDVYLQKYFWAMSWLAQIDFRLVDYDPSGKPRLSQDHLASAVLLRQILDETGQRRTWTEIDDLFAFFIGQSDNVTLTGLDRFLGDAQIKSAADVLTYTAPAQLLKLLTTNDYGQQRIAGQPISANPGGSQPTPQAVSFMLFGQRYAVDSEIASNLSFDRLIANGQKIQRPYPSPLDVMYVLGNDRALTHLQPRLKQYNYLKPLDALREKIDQYPGDYWTSSIYNRWLGLLRKLNKSTTGTAYPQSMRTAAWADKVLNTQLASWTQLRHDNILYVKQSFTAVPLCEYPAGYVEPYPEFYAAVQDYARWGQAVFARLSRADESKDPKVNEMQADAFERIPAYFAHLESVANKLKVMAEKELRLEPFTPDEVLFLKSIVLYKVQFGCGIVEDWDGWYSKLFPWNEDSPAMVTDLHTNLNRDPSFPELLPPGVLHTATGDVATAFFIVDTDEGPTIYVGPAFTYYEMVEVGYPPNRLADEAWKERLTSKRPSAPTWSASFRPATSQKPEYLRVPLPTPSSK